MASAQFRRTEDGIGIALLDIVRRGRNAGAFLDRVIWPKFQQAQIERWETENSSQGAKWAPLEPRYARLKKKKFAAYPGAGNVMMVATSRLSQGAQGRNTEYFGRIVGDYGMEVAINITALPYATHAPMMRPYMAFSDDTMQGWTDAVAAYIMKGKQ